MIAILAVFAVVGIGLIATGERLGRRALWVGTVPVVIATVWVALHLDATTDGRGVDEHLTWVRALDLNVDLRLDAFAATMSLIVAGVGILVFLYAASYFGPAKVGLGRLAGLLVLFAGAMLGLVQADNLLLLYVCWELTSVTSYLLIGDDHTDPRARAAALHALLVTGAGGLALLGGIVVLGTEAGTFRLGAILARPPTGTAVTVALVLMLLGAFTKSAQYPFHSWLPGAMVAPTPVSAYLHSATMVTAGVYLVARLAPAFASVSPWRPLVLAVGCTTMVLGGVRALRRNDLKLLLAFGTVSQLGLMMVLFGAGTPEASVAGWVLLVAHAAFKAALFMVVGIIDHQTGTRDRRRIPVIPGRALEIVTVVAGASMAGVPLLAGFIAKESAYEALGDARFSGHDVVLAAAVVGSMLTVAYTTRFWWGAFGEPRRRAAAATGAAVRRPSAAFVAPVAVLAAVGVVLGVVPGIEDALAGASFAAYPGRHPADLALWHGVNDPLLLSALTLGGGIAIFLGDRFVQPLLARGRAVPSGDDVYVAGVRGLRHGAARVTGVVQNGSLPVYTGVILATAVLLPGTALLVGVAWPGWPAFGSARDVAVLTALLAAAVGAAAVRRRFAAALFLGVAGYAMAGFFVLSGAPDLALTQATVETLSTVVFVLVLRRLPERFERQSTAGRRIGRLAIAASVGVVVFLLALVAAGNRITPPVSHEMIERAVTDGHGRNVVNVILVDFRGFDTLGEITVLAVASIGAVALARVGRRAAEAAGERTRRPPPVRRLPFVDVSVRIVFPIVVMASLWLLFAGHNQPGGGFVGGLLAGSAIALRYVAGGIDEVRGSRFRPWTVLGAGLLLAVVTASVPLLTGDSVLQVGLASWHLWGLGAFSISSALVFDVGVYLAVVGMVLMAFEAFGDEPAPVPS
jgi:multicomponent Na+:H+ antiporter subunit A